MILTVLCSTSARQQTYPDSVSRVNPPKTTIPKTLNALPMSHKPTDREFISGNDDDDDEPLLSLPLPACSLAPDAASLAASMLFAADEGKGTALLWSVVVDVVFVFVELVLASRLAAASWEAMRRVLVLGSGKEEAAEERHLRHMAFEATAVPGRASGRRTAAAAAALRRAGSLSDILGDGR